MTHFLNARGGHIIFGDFSEFKVNSQLLLKFRVAIKLKLQHITYVTRVLIDRSHWRYSKCRILAALGSKYDSFLQSARTWTSQWRLFPAHTVRNVYGSSLLKNKIKLVAATVMVSRKCPIISRLFRYGDFCSITGYHRKGIARLNTLILILRPTS